MFGAGDQIVYSHFTSFVGPFPNRNGLNVVTLVLAYGDLFIYLFIVLSLQVKIPLGKNRYLVQTVCDAGNI